MPRGRTIGMTRGYKLTLHGDTLKQAEQESAEEELVEQQLVEQPEDESSIFNLPDSPSGEESGGQLSDGGNGSDHSPPLQQPSFKSPELEKKLVAGSYSPPEELSVAASFVHPLKFTFSTASESSSTGRNAKKRNSRMDEGDTSGEDKLPDPFNPRTRVKNTYGRIRNSLPRKEKKEKSNGNGSSPAAKKQKAKKENEAFKNPLQYMSHADRSTPPKNEETEKFMVPLVLSHNTPDTRATRSKKFKNPKLNGAGNGLNIKDPPKTTPAKFNQPEFLPPPVSSSIATSSLTPMSNYAASSSSFSSAPDSPEIEASIQDIDFDKSDITYFRYPPTMAKCPVCNAPVERSFLERYDSGVHLHVRQQIRFCKAHRARTAQSEWETRGYPKIDWKHFDKRLARFHGELDLILMGKRESYYRNAFEDHQKSGRNRTLQQCLVSGSRMEGLELGYYGSKGGKLMMENIVTNFSHKIRRLGASDKLLASAGVSTFVQAVLTPELAVMLVMQDMGTDEEGARAVLRDSTEVGNLLNEEEDEIIKGPEPENDDERSGKTNYSQVVGDSPKRKKKKKKEEQGDEGGFGRDLERQQEKAEKKKFLNDILGTLSEDEDEPMIDT